jgi:hypothetical protein
MKEWRKMVRTILVFFDGSGEARRTFDLTMEIAEQFQAKKRTCSTAME